MQLTKFLLLSLAIPALAAPAPGSSESSLDLTTIFERAVGDKCKAPEGSGSCQNKAKCNGISYPTGLCPKDPTDVQVRSIRPATDLKLRTLGESGAKTHADSDLAIQCCVEIKCKAPYGSHLCRSVKNNGCSGGTFKPGYCPGSTDIQCCVKNAPAPPAPSPPVQDPNEWPACQKKLSCTFAQIAASSMASRLAYVRYMQSNFFGRLKAGNQYRAIEGVIVFFERYKLGPPQSWISYVDAGIVEGIQRGGAIVLGMSTNTGGNPGSEKWATFLRGMRDGKLKDRGVSFSFH